MTRTARRPMLGATIHPGEILKEEFMQPLGLTINGFARKLGTTPANLSRIVNGRQAISAEMAYRLSRSLGTSYQFWLNLQDSYAMAKIGSERLDQIDREVEPASDAA